MSFKKLTAKESITHEREETERASVSKKVDDVFGMLNKQGQPVVSVEEMKQSIVARMKK